jgi:hypothetical protein
MEEDHNTAQFENNKTNPISYNLFAIIEFEKWCPTIYGGFLRDMTLRVKRQIRTSDAHGI